MSVTTRERLVSAAFELADQHGWDATSVDDITTRAGTGRTTFFRHFRSKEDVALPDHDALLARVEARLATATARTEQVALREAARIVLDHYLTEGDTARARFRLTRGVPALRERELASVHRYVLLFARHLRSWYADTHDGALRAELTASAVITAHNHVLRAWLCDQTSTPSADFDEAMDLALAPAGTDAPTRTIVIRAGDADVESTLAEVRAALTGSPARRR